MNNSLKRQDNSSSASRFKSVTSLRNLDFGPVTLAYDLKTQETLRSLRVYIQLSTIPHDILRENSELTSLRSALAALRAQQHPHLLRVYEAITEDGCELVSLEHVEALPLSAVLGRVTLTVSEIVRILLQTTAGLQALHNLGFQPLGISPKRILVQRDGSIKIDPIGAALLKNPSLERFKGLPMRYQAPESTSHLTGSADQFALGVIGQELLLGRTLFAENANGRKLINVWWSAVRTKISRRSAPPAALIELLTALLAPDPELRPSISYARNTLELLNSEFTKSEVLNEVPTLPAVFDLLLNQLNASQSAPTVMPESANRTSKPAGVTAVASGASAAKKSPAAPSNDSESPEGVQKHATNYATVFVFGLAIYLVTGLLFLSWYLGIIE